MVKINISDIPEDNPHALPADAPLLAKVIASLKMVYDPELPVNVYDLGLIYRLEASQDGVVTLDMTLTAPNCPVADQIVEDITNAVKNTAGVTEANVTLVWDPKWHKDMMSEAAKLELGFFE